MERAPVICTVRKEKVVCGQPFLWFIADKRELETKTVVSDRVLSPNKTYTNYRFHVESYVPVFILG
ncbi:hypothetical protein ACRTC7_10150, partial [Vibrio fluvialis]|uniref:hypothetical protein n=1 Tax=Vibrio fluvialis TaxID=676 RepID=UPI003D7DBA33